MDGFIGCSAFTVEAEVGKRFPEFRNSFVVSNGVDTDKFDPARIEASAVDALKRKHSINKGDVTLLYVGRLTEDKGAFQLLQAARELVKTHGLTNLKLMVVGSGFYGGKTKITPFMKKLHTVSEGHRKEHRIHRICRQG